MKNSGETFLERHGNKISALAILLLVIFLGVAFEISSSHFPSNTTVITTTHVQTATSTQEISYTQTITQSAHTVYQVIQGAPVTTTQNQYITEQEYATLIVTQLVIYSNPAPAASTIIATATITQGNTTITGTVTTTETISTEAAYSTLTLVDTVTSYQKKPPPPPPPPTTTVTAVSTITVTTTVTTTT